MSVRLQFLHEVSLISGPISLKNVVECMIFLLPVTFTNSINRGYHPSVEIVVAFVLFKINAERTRLESAPSLRFSTSHPTERVSRAISTA